MGIHAHKPEIPFAVFSLQRIEDSFRDTNYSFVNVKPGKIIVWELSILRCR